MSESSLPIIPIPKEGFLGIQSLIAIGEERLGNLAGVMAVEPLSLSFSDLCQRLGERLPCDRRILQTAFIHALIPLNGLRRSMEMRPSDFLEALVQTVLERAPAEWREKHEEKWLGVSRHLAPFFEPDNFFSQASKAFDLLSERPAVLQSARLLTELRPIYDEATTETLAHLLTSTLVVDYWDGQTAHSLHVSLDRGDLEKLAAEIKRAQTKISVSQDESVGMKAVLVIFGDSEE